MADPPVLPEYDSKDAAFKENLPSTSGGVGSTGGIETRQHALRHSRESGNPTPAPPFSNCDAAHTDSSGDGLICDHFVPRFRWNDEGLETEGQLSTAYANVDIAPLTPPRL